MYDRADQFLHRADIESGTATDGLHQRNDPQTS